MGKTIAIYPGSFDPVTRGHMDIIERASKTVDHLIVGVLVNSAKKSPLFTVEERVALLKQVTAQYPNVEIRSFEGLLVDFARASGAHILIRGLRAVTDFEYELQMSTSDIKEKIKMSKIEQLIGEIEEFIDGCKLQPFSSTKIVVDKAQLEDLLVELRHRTPDEIKKYQKILNNKDAIINDAKQQAEAIISAANVQTSEMVNQSEITKRAYARANEIITQATQQANEIVNKAIEDANALRTGAIAYTDDMMGSMEQTLAQGLDGLKEKYEEMLSTMNTTVETIRANRKELPKAEDVIISAAPADTAEEELSEEE